MTLVPAPNLHVSGLAIADALYPGRRILDN